MKRFSNDSFNTRKDIPISNLQVLNLKQTDFKLDSLSKQNHLEETEIITNLESVINCFDFATNHVIFG